MRRARQTARPGLAGTVSAPGQGSRRIIGNTGWLLFEKILRLGMGLFVGVWIARYLGPQRFGLLSYALAFVALFGPLAGLGIEGVVVRELVRRPAARPGILGTAFVLRLTAGLLAWGLLALIAQVVSLPAPAALTLILIIGAAFVFQALGEVIDLDFRARVASRSAVLAKSLAFLLICGVQVVLISRQAPLPAFALTYTAELALAAGFLVWVYLHEKNGLRQWRVNREQILAFLRDCWPLVLSSIAILVYLRIDQIMLGSMLGQEAVGLYAAAARISEAWYFVPVAIVQSVFPAIIRAREKGGGGYMRNFQALLSGLALLSYLVALPVSLLAPWLMATIFGATYAPAAPVLTIHIWAGLFVALNNAQGAWHIAEGLERLTFLRSLQGAIANVLLNLFLIPRYGITGAAVATVMSYAIAVLFSNLLRAETRRLFTMQIKAILLPLGDLVGLWGLVKSRPKES